MARVNQVNQTPLLYTYTRGNFTQLSDSIGVHRGKLINLINPCSKIIHGRSCVIVDHRAERISAEGPLLGRATAGTRNPRFISRQENFAGKDNANATQHI